MNEAKTLGLCERYAEYNPGGPSDPRWDQDEEQERCSKVHGENGNCPLGRRVTCSGCEYE